MISLKKCRYCSKKIDDDASVCPHCRKNQKGSSLPLIIILLIITVVVIVGFNFFNKQQLIITNANGNVDSYGYLKWEGDITNQGYYMQKNIKVNVICYTEAREAVGLATTTIKYINPGETLHFTASGTSQYLPNLSCEITIK